MSSSAESLVNLYGTAESVLDYRHVKLGRLDFLYSDQGIRDIRIDDTEVLRGVNWPIRNKDWGTYAQIASNAVFMENEHEFACSLNFSVADGQLDCNVLISADSDGRMTFELDMSAVQGDFATNRAGFTVLHPLDGLVGEPMTVVHTDGRVNKTSFPVAISPSQPVLDIRKISYSVAGISVSIDFEGEVFEMEDQRNWSDASFKTYCVPLSRSVPYVISDGETISQTVTINTARLSEAVSKPSTGSDVKLKPTGLVASRTGLVVENQWIVAKQSFDMIVSSGVDDVVARFSSIEDLALAEFMSESSNNMGHKSVVELVLSDADSPEVAIESYKALFSSVGYEPTKIVALRESYLSSHQPCGPWPVGPSPDDLLPMLRHAFPNAEIGCGALTNFTELNRCRPEANSGDFLTHGSTALVHASDDKSVIETLETYPQIFKTASEIANGKPYCLGLVSIGMRSNPYGDDVAENPNVCRQTMAQLDPRHRGLFGAAWAVGVLAATADCDVASLCLAAPSGPFGLQMNPRVVSDIQQSLSPLFHVVKFASSMSGRPKLVAANLPQGVHLYGVGTTDLVMGIVANLSSKTQLVSLPYAREVRLLEERALPNAAENRKWSEDSPAEVKSKFGLPPFAVAFLQRGLSTADCDDGLSKE